MLDELTPAQAIGEEERAATKGPQELRGTGGRRMGVDSDDLDVLEAAASGRPPEGLAAELSRSHPSGPTHGGVTGQHGIFSGGVGSDSMGIAAWRAEAGAPRGESSCGWAWGNAGYGDSMHYGLPDARWGPAWACGLTSTPSPSEATHSDLRGVPGAPRATKPVPEWTELVTSRCPASCCGMARAGGKFVEASTSGDHR